MNKCVFVLYHDINVDGRSEELLKCAMLFGETTLVSYKPYLKKTDECAEIVVAGGKRNYVRFLMESAKVIKKIRPNYLFLENSYDAPLIKIAKKFNKDVKIIYDVSELYISNPINLTKKTEKFSIRVKQKLSGYFSIAESKSIHLVDAVTIPSRERALIFQGYYALKNTPIVFDNMHKLADEVDEKKYDDKYQKLLAEKFIIIYGGGIADSRYTFELCEAVKSLGENYLLLICGAASKQALEQYTNWLTESECGNIKYLGMLKKDEWRYLVQRSHITVSAYKFLEMNLIFCASGKVYEGLFEGKPLLASKNPPFVTLCEYEKVGVSTEDFAKGIQELQVNYDWYCKNVHEYIRKVDYDARIDKLKEDILRQISMDSFNV